LAGPRWGADPVLVSATHWRELLAGLGLVIGPRGTRALVLRSLALCLEQGAEVGTEVSTVMRLLTQSQPSDEVLAWWLAAVDGETRTLQPVLRGVALQLLGPQCCQSLMGLVEWPRPRPGAVWPARPALGPGAAGTRWGPAMTPPRRLSPGPSTARSLVLLAAHAQRLQARVAALRAEMPQALAGARQAAQLLAANEHLVLAALQAQTRAALSLSELQALTQQSQRDALTRIPNRALMQDRLAQAISHASRNSALLALFFIDIDGFKQINDAHGHAAGDTVLKTVATRLAACVRQSDTVCRHGGDEFLVLLPELAQPEDALALADKVMAALMQPCSMGATTWPLSVSLGLAIYPRDASSAEALTACADRAMYRAKAGGGGRVFDGADC